jgi:dTDP-D-glucose 4,6-dehydratase
MPLSDVEFYGLRFGSVNGWAPNFRLDLMINAMSFSAINQKKVNVFNGHAYRPILPINDLCRAVETIILSTEDRRGLYNVAAENENILQIGIRVAKYFNVPLIDNVKNFTYDFSISSQKFMNTFNFTFNGTIETIIDSIVTNPHDPRWERRDEIRRK